MVPKAKEWKPLCLYAPTFSRADVELKIGFSEIPYFKIGKYKNPFHFLEKKLAKLKNPQDGIGLVIPLLYIRHNCGVVVLILKYGNF